MLFQIDFLENSKFLFSVPTAKEISIFILWGFIIQNLQNSEFIKDQTRLYLYSSTICEPHLNTRSSPQ